MAAGPFLIEGAADGQSRFVQHMSVNHRRRNVLVAEEFLHSTDVVAVFEQMCGEAVPERVATRSLRNADASDRQFHGVLEIFSPI